MFDPCLGDWLGGGMLLLRWVLFLAWLFPFVLTYNLYAKSQEAIGQTFLELIAVEEIEDEAVITIQSNQRFSFVDFVLYKPARLLIEVVGANIFAKKDAREILNAALIKEVYVGYFVGEKTDNSKMSRVDFISFTFNQNFEYEIDRSDREVMIRVKGILPTEMDQLIEGAGGDPSSLEEMMDPEALKKMVAENPELAQKMKEQEASSPEGKDGIAPEGEDSEERKQIKGLKSQDLEAKESAKKARDQKAKDKEEIFSDIKAERVHDEKAGLGEDDVSGDLMPEEEIEKVQEEVAQTILKIRSNQELTETGLVVPKESIHFQGILDAVQDRRKEMLFFEKEKILSEETKSLEVSFKNQMSGIVKELQRYLPLTKPNLNQLSINECAQIALNNHLPAQIALEKVKLAKLKLWEARRNIFPKMTFEINKTKGEADALPFFEEDYKLTMDQTLFDGGEVKFLLEQSRVNLEVSKRTFDKIKSELTFEVEEAYFNLIMAKMNLGTQRRLLQKVTKVMKHQQLMMREGLVRVVDFQNIKSSYNQVQFQVAGTVKDMAIGELTLRQKMSIPSEFVLDTMDTIGFKNIEMNLQDSLWLAYKYRPEYLVNKLMVDFQNYDRLANIAKGSFRIDFSSRYGYGGSAFQNGILHLQEQWFTGLKVTKGFGGNTVESNIIKEHAFPRLGQTSRGNTYTRSLKVSILDNLKVFSDKKQADITFQEAVLEVGKLEKQIETDVRNAFYDYQKAIIQIDSAFDKVIFREEEVKVNKTMVALGEATAVQLLDSEVRLADEKSFYFQGIINYYVAIANMNKAIGLISYYQ